MGPRHHGQAEDVFIAWFALDFRRIALALVGVVNRPNEWGSPVYSNGYGLKPNQSFPETVTELPWELLKKMGQSTLLTHG